MSVSFWAQRIIDYITDLVVALVAQQTMALLDDAPLDQDFIFGVIGRKMEHCAATGVGTQEPTVVGKQVDSTGYRLTTGVAVG